MGFTITSEYDFENTQVANRFLLHYMPAANGNYVKVYLYLLLFCQHPELSLGVSVDMLADRLECTENDILRSLRYWKKEGLLDWTEQDDDITGILLRELPSAATPQQPALSESVPKTPVRTQPLSAAEVSSPVAGTAPNAEAASNTAVMPNEIAAAKMPNEIVAAKTAATAKSPAAVKAEAALRTAAPKKAAASASAKEKPVPAKQTYTPLQAEALSKDIEINSTISTVEQLLGTPVTPAHLQLILYFMCDVGFSSALLITLYETALKKGKTQPNYIEAIGISWAKKGITTPEAAGEEAADFSGKYALAAHALGIRRSLAPAEREIIDGWESYHFSPAIIEEACKRTVLQTGDTNLHYVSKILSDWHKKHVISLDDIEKCDASYRRQKSKTSAGSEPKRSAAKNQFQNFPQRNYSSSEFESLEKTLLHGRTAQKR